MHRQGLGNLGRSPSAEKHARMVLVTEGREGPNTQDQAGHLIAMGCRLFEDMKVTYHPPSIPDEVACRCIHGPRVLEVMPRSGSP